MPGTLHDPHVITMSRPVGVAESAGDSYELSVAIDKSPMVRSGRTGRTWSLSWEELIDQARAAGVDEGEPAPEGGPHAA